MKTLFTVEAELRRVLSLVGKIVPVNPGVAGVADLEPWLDEVVRVYFAERMVVEPTKIGIVLSDTMGPNVYLVMQRAPLTQAGTGAVGQLISWVDGAPIDAWSDPLNLNLKLVEEMNATFLRLKGPKPFFVGYMGAADESHPVSYRLKTLDNKRINPGATLDQKGKAGIIDALNAILPASQHYSGKNANLPGGKDSGAMNKYTLGVICEIVARHLTRVRTAATPPAPEFDPDRSVFFVTCEQFNAGNMNKFVVNTITVAGNTKYVYNGKG